MRKWLLASRKYATEAAHLGHSLQPKVEQKIRRADLIPVRVSEVPRNAAGVQLLSPHLSAQIFGQQSRPESQPNPKAVEISLAHLHKHGLALKDTPPLPMTSFNLPPLQGDNIASHFESMATQTVEPFLERAEAFASADLPPKPDNWCLVAGWVKYYADGTFESVPYPDPEEGGFCFDVETMYRETPFACLATAASHKGWYSWISPWLLGISEEKEHLIPMPASGPRIIVGHNVGYDRARLAEEYDLKHSSNSNTRFIDTMSLHVACNGLSSPQRPAWIAYRKNKAAKVARSRSRDVADQDSETGEIGGGTPAAQPMDQVVTAALSSAEVWQDVSSLNSLVEVAKLHCGLDINKDVRDVFGSHSPEEVRAALHDLLSYCADDVSVTHQVFRKVWPKFRSACPSNVTLSGVLTMSKSFLPVDGRWEKFLEQAESTYEAMHNGVGNGLAMLAEKARLLMYSSRSDGEPAWKSDLWMEQLDWSPKTARRAPLPQEEQRFFQQLTGQDSIDRTPQTLSSSHSEPSSQSGLEAALSTPTSPQVMPFLLQATWKDLPIRYDASHGFHFFVPKGHCKRIAATKNQPKLIDVVRESDGPGHYYQITTGRAGSKASPERVTDLFGENMAWARKSRASQDAILKIPQVQSGEDLEGSARRRAREIRQLSLRSESLIDPWLAQLSEYRQVSDRDSKRQSADARIEGSGDLSQEQKAILDRSRRVWPKWYWDLDRRPSQGEPGLHLSTRTRIAPLLLRLTWKDQPIFFSKQHGWVFRISTTADRESFGLSDDLQPLKFEDTKHDEHLSLASESGVFAYYKLPHHDGGNANVGSPLSKGFVAAFEDGRLSAKEQGAKDALEMNAKCSYWVSSRERILKQMTVWQSSQRQMNLPPPSPESALGHQGKTGLILPQVITMGTVTRRAVENTWLTASNAKATRVGSELKSLIRAPAGYTIVGADVDSEELWICAVMGDAYFGLHGATALGWMTLEGSKSAGTDMHSITAKILGITRDGAKVFNYSRIYGAGVRHAVDLLKKGNPDLSLQRAQASAKELYARTKGKKRHQRTFFDRKFWYGGTESHVFNMLETIATSSNPRTPTLGCGVTQALRKSMLPETSEDKAGEAYLPSRINWVVQSSGVDYLHLLLVGVEYLIQKHDIDAKYLISVHDDLRYLVKDEDKLRFALILQIANLWTRSMFAYSLGINNLPQVRF